MTVIYVILEIKEDNFIFLNIASSTSNTILAIYDNFIFQYIVMLMIAVQLD